MACFLVPAAEAVVTTVVKRTAGKKLGGSEDTAKHPFIKKLGLLNNMLWGGSALLAFEHVWHGEITPMFPFLTAANAADVPEMLHEMATSGVAMAALVTVVWAGIVVAANILEKKPETKPALKGGVR